MQKAYYYEGYDHKGFAKILVEQGYYGDLPAGVINAIDWDKMFEELEYDGYVDVGGGIVYLGDDPFEIKED